MPKPRSKGNGEGTIYRRKDGSYAAQYHVETSQGRNRKTIYGKKREDVAAKLAKAIADRDGGLVFDAGAITVGQYLDGFLAEARNRCRPKVHRRYCDLAKCHIRPVLERVKLKDLRPDHLRAVYRARLDAGLSARTVQHAHTLIKQALRQAVADGLIPRNVAEAVKPPRNTPRDMRPLTPTEARSFLAAASGERYEALYVLAVTAGLRRGELLGLRWGDVDLERGVLAVRRTLQGGELLPPKTPRSRRSVRLTALAVDALRRHRKRQRAEGLHRAGGTVFSNASGNPTDADNLCSRHFKPLLRRAGLPPIRFHDLRHTCATLLLSKGVHVKIVSELLGHASVTITLDTYSHVLPDMQDGAASAMDDALG